MTSPPPETGSHASRSPPPATTASCAPRSTTRLSCRAIRSVSSMLMPALLPLGPNPSPLSFRSTRENFGFSESGLETSSMRIALRTGGAGNSDSRIIEPPPCRANRAGGARSDGQHPVPGGDGPALGDAAVLDHQRLAVQGAGRADVGRHRVDHVAGGEAVGVRRGDHEVFLVVQQRLVVGNVQEGA